MSTIFFKKVTNNRLRIIRAYGIISFSIAQDDERCREQVRVAVSRPRQILILVNTLVAIRCGWIKYFKK